MWPFSSSTPAGPSKLPETAPVPVSETFEVGSAPAEPSEPSNLHIPPSINRWEKTLKDEEEYQGKVYADYKEVPGCMTIMDDFFICYALGPQLRNFYKHGTYKDCQWRWADFKYCLSLKSEEEEVRRQLWIKRRADWWAKKRVGPSSEDVWDRREAPLVNFPPVQGDEIPVNEAPGMTQ